MKIRIEHTNNPLNYGTNMMVANLIYYLDKNMKEKNNFNIDVYNDEDLNIYKNQYPELNISRETIDYNFFYSENIVGKIKNKLKRDYFYDYFNKYNLIKLENSCDKLIILGGDDLSEYYGITQLQRELYKLKYIKDKVDVFLVGQTIGPFSEEISKIAKEALEGIKIYTRDPWTKEYLENNLGLSNIKSSSDLAFLQLPQQNNKLQERKILNKYFIDYNKYITIIPSGLYESYCKDKEKYVEVLYEIIKFLRDEYSDKKIVLLPHVLRPKSIDDRNIIKELENKLLEEKNIIYIYDQISPLEARFILGNGIFTLTGRMHGAINTFQMRKPAISISYSVKYNGVIGRDLNMHELIVNGEKDDYWHSGQVTKETIEKIKYLNKNYKLILKKIEKSVSNCENNVSRMICNIAKELEK